MVLGVCGHIELQLRIVTRAASMILMSIASFLQPFVTTYLEVRKNVCEFESRGEPAGLEFVDSIHLPS
jgi:hypothetical protein